MLAVIGALLVVLIVVALAYAIVPRIGAAAAAGDFVTLIVWAVICLVAIWIVTVTGLIPKLLGLG